MRGSNTKALKKYLNFLSSDYEFKLKEVKSGDYSLHAKFLSDNVGVYFEFEYRDRIPDLQVSMLLGDDLKPRPNLYTIYALYKDETFILRSFGLSEIMYKMGSNYLDYFKDIKTIEDSIKIAAELLDLFARDFLNGKEQSYVEMDTWFRDRAKQGK